MIIVDQYKDKKLLDYIQPNGRYLLRFGHGAGDSIMFMPLLDWLRSSYPKSIFDLYVECGQEEIWDSVDELEPSGYDIIFIIHFPMSEGTDLLKQHKCGLDEIGIPFECLIGIPELVILPQLPSPLVALHFHGTALPNSVNCPEKIAKQVWQEVKDFGLIPIEVHFQHVFHNKANVKFNWIDLSVRNYRATLQNLFGLIQRCHAFIGVASGPLVAAMSIMPERTMYLERSHPLRTYTTDERIQSVDVMDYECGSILKWLEGLCQDI